MPAAESSLPASAAEMYLLGSYIEMKRTQAEKPVPYRRLKIGGLGF